MNGLQLKNTYTQRHFQDGEQRRTLFLIGSQTIRISAIKKSCG